MNDLLSIDQPTNEVAITLKELTDLIRVQHSKAMKKVEELAKEPSFGVLSKMDTINLNGLKVETYSLTKKQAIAVGARLNNNLLMKVVDRLEEIESKKNKPMTFLETAKALVESLEKNQALENKVNMLTHASKLYTSSEIAKELGFTSATALNKKLNEDNIHYKVNGTWLMYSKYSDKDYVSVKQHVLDNGRIVYDRKWTGIGREFLVSKYGVK